jgi:hypothetical protein
MRKCIIECGDIQITALFTNILLHLVSNVTLLSRPILLKRATFYCLSFYCDKTNMSFSVNHLFNILHSVK